MSSKKTATASASVSEIFLAYNELRRSYEGGTNRLLLGAFSENCLVKVEIDEAVLAAIKTAKKL